MATRGRFACQASRKFLVQFECLPARFSSWGTSRNHHTIKSASCRSARICEIAGRISRGNDLPIATHEVRAAFDINRCGERRRGPVELKSPGALRERGDAGSEAFDAGYQDEIVYCQNRFSEWQFGENGTELRRCIINRNTGKCVQNLQPLRVRHTTEHGIVGIELGIVRRN